MRLPSFPKLALYSLTAAAGLGLGWASKRGAQSEPAAVARATPTGPEPRPPKIRSAAWKADLSATGFRVDAVPPAQSFDDLLALAFDSDLGPEQLRAALAHAVSHASPDQLREWTRAIATMPEASFLDRAPAALASAILTARAGADLAGLLEEIPRLDVGALKQCTGPVVSALRTHPELVEKALLVAERPNTDPFSFNRRAAFSRRTILEGLLKNAPREPAAFQEWAASVRPLAQRFDAKWLRNVGDLSAPPAQGADGATPAEPTAEEAQALAAEPEAQKRDRALEKELAAVAKGGDLAEALNLLQSGDIVLPGKSGHFDRKATLAKLFESATEQDVDRAIAAAGTLQGDDLIAATTAIVRSAGYQQPEAAMRALALVPKESLTMGMLAPTLVSQAPGCTEQQRRLIDEILQRPDQRVSGDSVFLLGNNLELARHIITTHPDSIDRNYLSSFDYMRFPVDPAHVDESTAWAREIADPLLRKSVLSGMIRNLAMQDSAKAFELALDWGSGVGLEAAAQQSGYDPKLFDAQGGWLQKLPESDRGAAARGVIEGMKEQNVSEAAVLARTWLSQAPPVEASGQMLVDTVRSVATSLAGSRSPDEATA